MNAETWTPVLQAVVGSQAHGLATSESDVDRMQVAVAPSAQFFGLRPPTGRTASHVESAPQPDRVIHELGKFVGLALKCNPSILELLWLEEYETITPVGQDLIRLRRSFLSRRPVRDAFLGYATAQFKRFVERGDGTFSSDTRNRTLKHSRHLIRLVQQGLELYKTGEMTVRVRHPKSLLDLAEHVVTHPEIGQAYLDEARKLFDEEASPLPEEPATTEVDEWLQGVRIRHLINPGGMTNPVVPDQRSTKE